MVEAVASGTSQSAVSRPFVNATAERLAEFRSRPLDDQRWLICFVDGFDFAGHTMVGTLGVTGDGTKVPLGVVEGSIENAAVVRGLIAGLRDRGLDASEGILCVLDGGKALAKAVRAVFGELAVIARCRLHKERPRSPARDRAAPSAPEAARRVGEPERRRGRSRPRCAGRPARGGEPRCPRQPPRGLADTLTVTRLGITGALLKTVMSTNPVESMVDIVRDHARNVKRWHDGDMRLRWAAAGMLAASTQFRRVKGYRQLPQLARAPRPAGYPRRVVTTR